MLYTVYALALKTRLTSNTADRTKHCERSLEKMTYAVGSRQFKRSFSQHDYFCCRTKCRECL